MGYLGLLMYLAVCCSSVVDRSQLDERRKNSSVYAVIVLEQCKLVCIAQIDYKESVDNMMERIYFVRVASCVSKLSRVTYLGATM